MGNYVKSGDLNVYKAAVDLGREAWKIYTKMDWQQKKVIGDQFVRSSDSVGSNIAEGYGRFHFLDKAKFYYNARGSLFETEHWALVLFERKIIDKNGFDLLIDIMANINRGLNGLITSTKSYSKN